MSELDQQLLESLGFQYCLDLSGYHGFNEFIESGGTHGHQHLLFGHDFWPNNIRLAQVNIGRQFFFSGRRVWIDVNITWHQIVFQETTKSLPKITQIIKYGSAGEVLLVTLIMALCYFQRCSRWRCNGAKENLFQPGQYFEMIDLFIAN